MARYRSYQNIRLSDSIELIKSELERDVFYGAASPTRIRVYTTNTIVDNFTEEITYLQSDAWFSASGIIRTIKEGDSLLGQGGRVKIGDSSVLYPFDAISGLYASSLVREIEINTPMASGLYYVAGKHIAEIAGTPVLIEFALTLDRNG